MSWKAFLESARQSAKEVEVLTYRIGNGGRDWSAGGVRTRSSAARSPTESAAIMEMVVVPRLVAQREEHEEVVGKALAALLFFKRQKALKAEATGGKAGKRKGGDPRTAAGNGAYGHAALGAQRHQILAGVADRGGAGIADQGAALARLQPCNDILAALALVMLVI